MVYSRFSFLILVGALASCSITATRPVQEMSDTAAAIKAAREVNADTLAPDLFRQANETFFRAKNEYKFKNFKIAKTLAEKARQFAEQAEFDALRGGASRNAMTPSGEPVVTPPKPEAYPYPAPTGTPASEFPENPTPEATPSAVPTPSSGDTTSPNFASPIVPTPPGFIPAQPALSPAKRP